MSLGCPQGQPGHVPVGVPHLQEGPKSLECLQGHLGCPQCHVGNVPFGVQGPWGGPDAIWDVPKATSAISLWVSPRPPRPCPCWGGPGVPHVTSPESPHPWLMPPPRGATAPPAPVPDMGPPPPPRDTPRCPFQGQGGHVPPPRVPTVGTMTRDGATRSCSVLALLSPASPRLSLAVTHLGGGGAKGVAVTLRGPQKRPV